MGSPQWIRVASGLQLFPEPRGQAIRLETETAQLCQDSDSTGILSPKDDEGPL